MWNVFAFLSALFLAISGVLYFAPHLKLLNIVDYATVVDVEALNCYAAARMLLPVFSSAICAYVVSRNPGLTVPLAIATGLSILITVVWISAGAHTVKRQP